MLYTITPEQEKAALHEVIMSSFDAISQDLLLKYNSLSELVNSSTPCPSAQYFSSDDKDVIAKTLEKLFIKSFLNSDTSYSNLKNHFAKYANQSLVGTIAGVSITPQDFHKLITTNDNYNWLKPFLFVDSLPFSFMNEIEDRDQLFEGFLDNGYRSHPEILTLNHYKFSDEQYKSMINWEPGYLTLFAACPQTKHLVTEEDFAEEWYVILDGRVKNDAPHINYEYELAEAYRDLFHNYHLTEDELKLTEDE